MSLKADENSKCTIADNEDRYNIYNMAANEELLDKQKEVPDILIPLLERYIIMQDMAYVRGWLYSTKA